MNTSMKPKRSLSSVASPENTTGPTVPADIEVWGLKTCGTTRKALGVLGDRAVFKPIQGISKTLITQALRAVDSPGKVFNTSGESYRKGLFKDKVRSMTKDEIVAALVADPMLIKRPVVRAPRGLVVGFDEIRLRDLL